MCVEDVVSNADLIKREPVDTELVFDKEGKETKPAESVFENKNISFQKKKKTAAKTVILNKKPVFKNSRKQKQSAALGNGDTKAALPDVEGSFAFLKGGGEMGEIIRNYNWAQSSIGTPDCWPPSLRTTLGILLSSKFPMFLFWGKDLIQFYNDAYRPSLGNTGKHPAAIGQKGEDCWPEIWPAIKPLIDQVLSGGDATWSEDQLLPIYRNGTLENVYWTFSYSPARDEFGNVCGVLVICSETTGKVNVLNQLKLSDDRFQNLVHDVNVGIIVLAGEEMIVQIVNDAYGRLISHTVKELMGRPLFDIIPEVEKGFRHLLDNVRITGASLYLYNQEFTVYVNGEAKVGYVNLIYQPYKESDGTITGVMALCQDVTENVLAQKEIEDQKASLQNANEYLASIVKFSDDAIFSSSCDGVIESWNLGGEKMFGYTAQEVIGKNISIIIPPRFIATENDINDRICNDESIEHYETMYTKKNGQLFPVAVAVSPLKNHEGTIIGISKIVRNITLNKKYEEQLIQANKKLFFENEEKQKRAAELELVNKELESFSYSVSHDLRTPLRAINGFTKILKEDYLAEMPDDAKDLLNEVIENSNRMGELIDNLLGFSQIGKKDISISYINMNQLVNMAVAELSQSQHERILNINIKKLENINGDRNLIGLVFVNLIANAVKYTGKKENGVIEIGSYRKDFECVYYVKDNGAGFDMQYADKLFGVFQRLHSSTEFDGIGVGLAIVKKIILKHHGKVWAEGKVNEGACFYVSLPASP